MMMPFTANIVKTSASSFSITVKDHGETKLSPKIQAPSRIVVNKTFKSRLNKILNDRKLVYELINLCQIWKNAYKNFSFFVYDNYCDHDDVLEVYASWYRSALKAVYLSYTLKYHKTVLPPCEMCGHHVSDLCVVSEFVDQGEYLADATISIKCGKCCTKLIYLKLK